MATTDVIVSGDAAGFAQEIVVGPHRLTADEPIEVGGKNTGPSPYDLLLAALGSCTSMTVSWYARTKKWPLESVTVNLRHSKIHAADCRDCETKEGKIDRIERDIHFVGKLDSEQRKKLLEIADKCPVHRTLRSEIDIQTRAI
jgi:putative redox protein